MELASNTEIENSFNFDQIFSNPLQNPTSQQSSRFLDILDSPENSDNEEDVKEKEIPAPIEEAQESEESKNIGYFPTKVVLAKNLPAKTTELDLHSVCEVFGVVK